MLLDKLTFAQRILVQRAALVGQYVPCFFLAELMPWVANIESLVPYEILRLVPDSQVLGMNECGMPQAGRLRGRGVGTDQQKVSAGQGFRRFATVGLSDPPLRCILWADFIR